MGTNFYARIIPTLEKKEELKKAVDDNDTSKIDKLFNELYGYVEYDSTCDKLVGGKVHLGKRSAGWKFLWNPNLFIKVKGHLEKNEVENGHERYRWIKDGEECVKVYDLTKKAIKEFIDREDVEIYDEYGEKQDKEDFFNMAITWGYGENDKGWDGETYGDDPINDEIRSANKYGIYNKTSFATFIENCGYKLNKYYSDFYSDGMRFSTSREFC